jgi:hypothetical protein
MVKKTKKAPSRNLSPGGNRQIDKKKKSRKKGRLSNARKKAIERSDSVFDAHLSFSSESPVLHTNLQDTIWGRYPDIGIKAKESSNPESTPNIDGADLGRMFTRVTGLDFQTGEPDVEIMGNKPHIEIIFGYEKVKLDSPYFQEATRRQRERRLVYNKGYLLSRADPQPPPDTGIPNRILTSGNLLGTNNPSEIEVIRREMINLNNAVKDPNSHIHRNYKTQLERVNAILQRYGSAIRCNAKVDSKGQKRTQASIILANIPNQRKLFENLVEPTLAADGSLSGATMHVLGNRPLDTIFFNKPTEVELIVERSLGIQIATHPTSVADAPGGYEYLMDDGGRRLTRALRRDRRLGSELQSAMQPMLPRDLVARFPSQPSAAAAQGAAAAAQLSAAQLSAAQADVGGVAGGGGGGGAQAAARQSAMQPMLPRELSEYLASLQSQPSAAQLSAAQAAASQAAAQADVGEEETSLIDIARREVGNQRNRELDRLMRDRDGDEND